jgi:hypothetical protein
MPQTNLIRVDGQKKIVGNPLNRMDRGTSTATTITTVTVSRIVNVRITKRGARWRSG